MSTTGLDQEKVLREQELTIQRHATFASGMFRDEATIRMFLESLPEGVVVIDTIGTILFVSSHAEQMFGYQGREIIGTHFSCIYPEEERNAGKPDEQLGTAREQGRAAYEGWRLRKDGSRFWADVIITALFDDNGNPRGFSIVERDITERRRAEEELRKSELKLSKIFHSVPALIAITTLKEGRFIDVNEAWLGIFGYRRDEVIGRTSLELGLWESKSDRDKAVRILEEQGSVHNSEIRFRGKNGQTFTCLYSGELVDFDGERYLLSLVRDITEWKSAEEEIKRLNVSLEARAAELEDANRELEAFNYSVAHDLRNPLNVISSYCQAIKDMCGEKLDDQCRRYLNETYEGTLRMNSLIEALLQFSRLMHVRLNRNWGDLSRIAKEIAEELKLTGAERRVTFRIADGVHAEGDLNLLQVVLNNLLGNAWKYTATREEAVIEFGEMKIYEKTVYFVRDNGTGFDNAAAENIFAPFQRLPHAVECRGFGIGLATVERIIRRHGGRVWAEGELDKGASFYFTLQP
jgi:PAS domain S-box-containing protein